MFGNDGDDFAAGDCVQILFDTDNHVISSIRSTSASNGKRDEITLGNGSDIGIGGFDSDTIYGNEGMDIIVSIASLRLFFMFLWLRYYSSNNLICNTS